MSGSHCFSVRFGDDGRALGTTLPGARGRLLLARINKEKLPRKMKKRLKAEAHAEQFLDGFHVQVNARRGRPPLLRFGRPIRPADMTIDCRPHFRQCIRQRIRDRFRGDAGAS